MYRLYCIPTNDSQLALDLLNKILLEHLAQYAS
jgi:hypothetical protein